MSDVVNLTYDVVINQIGPLTEGFLDNDPYYLKVPLPTTLATSISKAKALYRWNFMIYSILEFATIEQLTNIVKTGSNLHDNPPTSISFRIKFDKNFYYVKTKDETGTYYELKIGSLFNAGSGYLPGDILSVTGGTLASGASPARFVVLSTTQTGQIVSLKQIDMGYYINPPTSPFSVTGGSGSGCQLYLSVIENPGLRGRLYLRRQIARALMFDGTDINLECYDPTPTPPNSPPPKPLIPRFPQRLFNVNFLPLAGSISSAESAITINIV